MPLYFGDSKVKMPGIKKTYLGDTLVFGKEKKPSRLPEGYTEVEYIQFDTKTGFNTGLYVIPTTIIVTLDVETGAAYSGVEEEFASMEASKAGQFSGAFYMLSFGRISETRTYCRAGSTSNKSYLDASITGKRLTVTYDGTTGLFWIGDEKVSVSESATRCTKRHFTLEPQEIPGHPFHTNCTALKLKIAMVM